MTVSVQTSFVEYVGNGVTTSFPYTFRVDNSSYFVVKLITLATLVEVTLTYGVDYTASGVGDPNGGAITYNPGPPMAATHKLRIERILPLTQLLDISSQSGFDPSVLEQALDNMTMMIQQADAKASLDVEQYAVAAAASALSAANSATSATASASSATASASSATTSASTATTQASNAATSASSASTSATNAATSATNAATSETNAAGSASSASTSAASAAASLAATLSAYDSFDDRYLGPKASDPLLDNDGNPLVAGQLYFNTGSGAMMVYTGSAWVAAYVSGTDFVSKLGDTMTGALTLNADPVNPLHATTKQYTDLRALRAGDTFTGKVNTPASASGGAGFNIGQGVDPSSPVNGDLWNDASSLCIRIAGTTLRMMPKQGGTFTSNVIFATPTTSIPSFRMPHGVAPSAPTDGDVWTTSAGGLFARVNGTTVNFSIVGHTHAQSDITNLVTDLAAKAAQGKQTIWIPASAMISRTTNGAPDGSVETTTNKVMLATKDFDPTTQEFAQFAIQLPKSWNAGTVTFRAVYSHPATATNFGVAWGLQAVAFSDDDAMDAAFGTGVVVTDTGGTTNDLYRTAESGAITIGGTPVAGDNIHFQVYREPANGSDTLAVDARLHGIELFYTTNAANDA